MCGRYAYLTSWSNIQFYTGAHVPLDALPQKFNLPPTQLAPIVRLNSEGQKVAELLKWGLVPPWAKDTKYAASCANARSESVAEKPSFKSAFRNKRCLVPVSGYYEWQILEDNKKQPYYIYNKDNSLLFLAGLWECWDKSKAGGTGILETFSIITTEANSFIESIHDRMPVILNQSNFELWLSPESRAAELLSLLVPLQTEELGAHRVSALVNYAKNDSESCIRPQENT